MNKYPFQNMPGLTNGEVEGGETVQLPTGEVFEFKGPSHKRGGIDAMLIPESRIFSKYLKLDKDTVKNIDGTSKKKSPAQLSKKFDPAKYLDILEDKSSRTDDLRKNTAQLMASKMSSMQDVVFKAQEEHKDYNKDGNYKYGGKVKKYQDGGNYIGLRIPQQTGFEDLEYAVPKYNTLPSTYDTQGFSYRDPDNNRLIQSVYQPMGGDPYFTEGIYRNRGLQTGRAGELTRNYQRNISNLQSAYNLPDNLARDLNTQLAFDLRDAAKADPDQNVRVEVVDPETRQRILVQNATDEQIRNANGELFFDNFVDSRLGNEGEATHNQQNFPAVRTTFVEKPDVVETLPTLPLEVRSQGTPSEEKKTEVVPPVGEFDDEVYEYPEEPIGISPEDLLFGIETGLDIAQLATLERQNPYYQYRPLETVQSRFDPINQLSQDRAFNVARNALERSNLPEQVKQAQLNQIQATNIQGRNQTDLTNFQADLQNDNQNLQRVVNVQNQNTINRENANVTYMQELQKARYVESTQRQALVDRLLENYRARHQQRENIGLINQLSRNYQFNPRTGRVEYLPNQGGPNMFDNLSNLQ